MDNNQGTGWYRLVILMGLVVLALGLSGCKQKMVGKFVGRTELHSTSYETGSFAQNTLKSEDVTATLIQGRTSSQFDLSFEDKSGLRCTLEVTNRNDEDSNTDNDNELNARIVNKSGESCEVREQNGKVQTAKVTNASGGTAVSEGAHTSFIIELQSADSKTNYKFSFEGNRK
jgi:hypothetical protein